jgi:hypothetical protein
MRPYRQSVIAQANRFAQSMCCAAAIPFLDLACACFRPAGGYRISCAVRVEVIRNLVGDPTIVSLERCMGAALHAQEIKAHSAGL